MGYTLVVTRLISVLCTRQRRKRKVQRARQGPSWREILPFFRSCKNCRTFAESGLKTHFQGHGSGGKNKPRVERQIRGEGSESH